MEAAYFSAALPEPYRILGLPLKPLSLGRYRLLKRFGCAFVSDVETKAGLDDLLLGVVVCSMRVDEFLERLQSGKLAKDVRRWARKVCPLAWFGLIPIIGKLWRRGHAFNVIEKMSLFKRYLDAGSEPPKYWDEGTNNRQSGAHWAHGVECVLRGELGWTEEEINEAPLTKAMADYFKFAEGQGLVRLMTDAELAMIKEAEGASGT